MVLAEVRMLELELREGLTGDLPADLRELEYLSELVAAELRTPEEVSKLLERTREGILKPRTLGLEPELWTLSGVSGLWPLELVPKLWSLKVVCNQWALDRILQVWAQDVVS